MNLILLCANTARANYFDIFIDDRLISVDNVDSVLQSPLFDSSQNLSIANGRYVIDDP